MPQPWLRSRSVTARGARHVAGALGTVFIALVASLTLVAGTASAAPATKHDYPVPYTFAAAIPAALHPYADPPGANDFSCKPSAAHPNPVVLTHGLGGNKNTNWQTFSPLLANEGYCVFALTYGVPDGQHFPPFDQFAGRAPIQQSAAELGRFVDQVLQATGAHEVDILGHSEGTVMPNYYVSELGGAAKVDKYVSLAPVWHGSSLAGLNRLHDAVVQLGGGGLLDILFGPTCAACLQVLTGSEFLEQMQQGGITVPGVSYTNIVTRYDNVVVPYTSGIVNEPGVTNITVQDECAKDFSDHLAIVASPVSAGHVLNALDPQHPRPVPCVPVAPFLGAA